ncbi:hypothetical protein [Exiguobacterium acetylicum]|uniref:hypothetical protein n=1 Tax=Exiguobacterium acetylicum TaxID=41170 RepID=UPI00067F9D98|nr:hypothetical protein [Exiguobacterium acetylicum]KNH34776.1 hypothetical protein ACS74_09755 [Exiguobacterium acetylicum]
MTLTEVAKTIYGKEYRKYIKKQNGRVVFTKKPGTTDNEQGYRSLGYVLDRPSKNLPMTTLLEFSTKQHQKTYYLTQKALYYQADTENGLYENSRTLMKPTSLRHGMTEKQLDQLVSGKKLGQVSMNFSWNVSSVIKESPMKTGRYKIYQFHRPHSKKMQVVTLSYNTQKKRYEVDTEIGISLKYEK